MRKLVAFLLAMALLPSAAAAQAVIARSQSGAVGALADCVDPSGNALRCVQPTTMITGSANIAASQGSVTTGSAQLVPARTGRRSVTIENESTTPVRIGPAGVTASTGFLLPGVAGASITVDFSGALYAVTASGTAAVSVLEVF